MAIDYKQYLPTEKELKAILHKIMEKRVKAVRSGKVIRRSYAASTSKRRRKFGLHSRNVDLTGNTGYSKKSWRLLDSWKIKTFPGRAIAYWSRSAAVTMYDIHKRRYGKILE